MEFQPTLPLRGATEALFTTWSSIWFQPTLPLRGATKGTTVIKDWSQGFNPRSPCGERPWTVGTPPRIRCFNPRSPCGERRHTGGTDQHPTGFNPRSPCGERHFRAPPKALVPGFNPRSPCGERRRNLFAHPKRGVVSTHAPLAGSDGNNDLQDLIDRVSTHAPLAGSDKNLGETLRSLLCFNPRSPCGERPRMPATSAVSRPSFNPRSPCGGRPGGLPGERMGGESFNPRSPCGERPVSAYAVGHGLNVSTHAPLAGSDPDRS